MGVGVGGGGGGGAYGELPFWAHIVQDVGFNHVIDMYKSLNWLTHCKYIILMYLQYYTFQGCFFLWKHRINTLLWNSHESCLHPN